MRPPRVTVFPHKTRPGFCKVIYTDHTKRRHVTSFDSREQAEAYAAQKRQQLFDEGIKSLNLNDLDRHEANLAVALLRPFGKGILDAARFLADHLKETQKNCTIAELVDMYVTDLEYKNVSPRHLANTRQQSAQFCRVFGAKAVRQVTEAEIESWLRKNDWGPVTQANHLRGVKTLFKFACKKNYAQINPAADIRPPKAEETEIEIYKVEEVAALLRAASEQAVPVMAIGAFAGLRTSELMRLDWAHVNVEEGFIEVKAKTAKTRQRRIVPISDNLKVWLRPFVKQEGLVISALNETGWHDAVTAAAEKAGVLKKANALRHSFASYREAVLKNVSQVSSEMGNSPSMVFQHYRSVVTPKAAEAFWAIYPEAEVTPISTPMEWAKAA